MGRPRAGFESIAARSPVFAQVMPNSSRQPTANQLRDPVQQQECDQTVTADAASRIWKDFVTLQSKSAKSIRKLQHQRESEHPPHAMHLYRCPPIAMRQMDEAPGQSAAGTIDAQEQL